MFQNVAELRVTSVSEFHAVGSAFEYINMPKEVKEQKQTSLQVKFEKPKHSK